MTMRNVEVKVVGKILTLKVDLSAEAELSKSQLSHVIASTGGLAVIEGGCRLNLNLTRDRTDLSVDERASLRAAAKAARAVK